MKRATQAEAESFLITQNPELRSQGTRFNDYPVFAPRIWHGMSVRGWLSLLRQNQFRSEKPVMSGWISIFAGLNSFANRVQSLAYRRRAMATPLAGPPVFVIGHWRTGTTFLHSLLARDDRFWTPTNHECFVPGHFLLSAQICSYLLQFPSRRPMDNMVIGWSEPQEDELALCARGATSVYRNIAFPKHAPQHLDSLTMENVSAQELRDWKNALLDFVRYLNLAHQRPLILKSPTHTGRVAVLLDMFPDAKFIHLTRSPYEFIPSTIYLWGALHATNGLQWCAEEVDRVDYVFDCFRRMYDGFHRQRALIPPGNLCEVAYDELTSDPAATTRRIYESLDLGDYGRVAEAIRQVAENQKNYQRNRHVVPAALSARILTECGEYLDRYCQPRVPGRKAA